MENNKKCGIYRIYCKVNGKSYYGQTNDYARRIIEHKKRLRHSSGTHHHCTYLQNAWNLYGEEQFEFSFVEECQEELLTEREQWYFDTYGPQNLLMNSALCAESTRRGVKLSDETKQKLREANVGPKSPMWGKKLSEEHKKALSESKIGNKNHNFGKPIPDDIKQKIHESLKGENCHLAKLTWSQIYEIRRNFYQRIKSAKQIAEELNMDNSTIYDILKNKTWYDPTYNPEEAIKILKQGNKKVNLELVAEIRSKYKMGEYEVRELADEYNIAINTTSRIINNKTWYDSEYDCWLSDNKKEIKKPTRINMQIAEQIRNDFKKNYSNLDKEKTYIDIGQRYNLASITVRKIIKNKLWINY